MRTAAGCLVAALLAAATAMAETDADSVRLGRLALEAGRLEEASEHLEAAVAEALPGVYAAWQLLGRLRLEQGRPEEALRCFDEAVVRAPRFLPARLGRARAALHLGRLDDAKHDLDALGHGEEFVRLLQRIRDAEASVELWDALSGYHRLLGWLGPVPSFEAGLARVAETMEAHDLARCAARSALASIPGDGELWYLLGAAEAGRGDDAVGVQAVYKDTTDLVGWEILGDGVYEPRPYVDPISGNSYVLLDPIVFPSLRKGNSPGFTVDPDADEYFQEYWAVILTFDRRMTDWWSMQASYTYSESTGLIPRFLSQWQFNPFYSSREGADPNSFLNASGQRLQGDRPHMLRVQANFALPWDMRANTSVNLQDGRPYTRQGRLPTEGRPVAILETGFRHGFQNLVDVGLGKTFKLKDGFEINFDLQVLNLLNDVETDWFQTVVLEPGDEFVPSSNGGWIKPRRFQLRAGLRF